MIEDDIIGEIRATREAFALAHNDALSVMAAYLREKNARGDWPVARLAPRRPAEVAASRPDPDLALTRTLPAAEVHEPS